MNVRAAIDGRPPMVISFIAWCTRAPIGGVTTLYQFANALADRGHTVQLCHLPFGPMRIESLDDLAWFDFHPRIEHHLIDPDNARFPSGDLVFGTGGPEDMGLRVHLIQGREILYAELERVAYRTPGLKVAIASWLTDAGEPWGFPAERCRVVLQGIDQEAFRVTVDPATRGRHVSMLHHTHPAKGWSFGLAALIAARERFGDLRATVFGTEAPAEDLPDWVDVVVEPDRRTLVEDIYNRTSVFVQPSTYEGFGLTAIEAMACGAALVTTDNGGSRDYAFDRRTALVVAPSDADALAAALIQALGDDALRLRLAADGRELVSAFTWARAGEEMEKVLRAFLDDPGPDLVEPGPERGDVDQGRFLQPYRKLATARRGPDATDQDTDGS